MWKRTVDVAFAGTLLLLLSPLFLVIGLLVRLDSPGPAFFRQERIGRNGTPFSCWKFRSMCEDAEDLKAEIEDQNEASGFIFKMKDDPRKTRVGKLLRRTSLDELPQLWNVARGDMSLVGPRPPLPSEVELYEPEHWARLAGVPGITGAWQVWARERLDFEEMMRLDTEYLANVSVRNDVRILAATIPVVLLGRGSH